MVDGFRYGRTGQWSEDQVPDLCGSFHEGVSDDHRCFRYFRRPGHAYSGQHRAVQGCPATIRTDQGPEFTCRARDQWAFEHGVDYGLSSQVSQCRTDLLRVLTDAFAMSV